MEKNGVLDYRFFADQMCAKEMLEFLEKQTKDEKELPPNPAYAEMASNFFVTRTRDSGKKYIIPNPDLDLSFENLQEACKFLVELIRYERKEDEEFFYTNESFDQYHERGSEEEKKGNSRYNLPYSPGANKDSENGWVVGLMFSGGVDEISNPTMIKIFGDKVDRFWYPVNFTNLPFVIYRWEHESVFLMKLLKYYAQHGHNKTEQLINEMKTYIEMKKIAESAQLEREHREKQEKKLVEELGDTKIDKDLFQQLIPFVGNETLTIHASNVAAVITGRSNSVSGAGVGRYSQVTVFYKGKRVMEEFQYRSAISASGDSPQYNWNGIAGIKVIDESSESVKIGVELKARKYDNQIEEFSIDLLKGVNIPEAKQLTEREQARFICRFEKQKSAILLGFEENWEKRPTMFAKPIDTTSISTGRPSCYHQPRIIKSQMYSEIGVAVFVIEVQIDHRGADRQMARYLYVLTSDQGEDEAMEIMAKENGYGCVTLTIIEVNQQMITIDTVSGRREIAIS